MKLTPLIFIVVISLTSNADAACWKEISSTQNSVISIDNCSITKDGVYKKAWFKSEYTSVQSTNIYPAKYYIMTKSLEYFNCSSRQSATIKYISYSAAGEVVQSKFFNLRQVSFEDPVPETVGETFIEYVCRTSK